MTTPQRRTHLTIWRVLTLILLVIFLAAIRARYEPAPANPQLRWEKLK